MLEVNDFSAVRISLASPEQIRSWSYGEVTKPETINYRTLKPERDGLFCERIFGPTKDFECYCGKYKRIRYKGVICDKCGVEVARSKVRRERMGHIELAAPVAHIWFVKGTPSRLGLLLDISPRSLEQVIYFAKYLIISVDRKAKERRIQELEEQRSTQVSPLEKELGEQVEQVKQDLEGELARLAQARDEWQARAPQGEAERETALEQVEAEMEARRASALEQITQIHDQMDEEREALEEKLDERLAELEELHPLAVLSEARYRDLRDKYGGLFHADMGAQAVLGYLSHLGLNQLREDLNREIQSSSGQRRKKAAKRLRVVEALRKSGNKPEWMILTVLPVLPPDLRPMVQLDGGRFATSDLNDLYRRVINRNNRLRRIIELKAPEIIVRNEKRMLQEAVDSLIDNGRRGRAVTTANNHRLKSLSDMLRGKQGRFRQNLLGKRVDYSGRSVIVVGPELKLHQCGLPKRMALELFKPFVMHGLVARGLAHNIKSAKRIVERVKPEVWDILEEVIKDRTILLNRAPTLHRLGIQAFQPVLIEGSAIQIHPLVCTAFNADFDGDQMAVHVPLSKLAVEEARRVLISTNNMLSPSSGEPLVAPTLDIVLGCYYLTIVHAGDRDQGRAFSSFDEARLAFELGELGLRAEIQVRDEKGQRITTTVGRILFNEVLPGEMGFINEVLDKRRLKKLTTDCYRLVGNEATAPILDRIKELGFRYATRSGLTIAMNDIEVPQAKPHILAQAERKMAEIERQFQQGLITEEERYNSTVDVWTEATDAMTAAIEGSMAHDSSVYMMATSGAKGNIAQIRQMAGMRGLMSDPAGRIIDLPIRSSFREGLTVLEYFISTHGARKGLADTALRTADSGYLTRRLIDAAQDVIILEEDCGTTQGIWFSEPVERGLLPPLEERLTGRLAAAPVAHPQTGEVILERNQEIDEDTAARLRAAGVDRVQVRSPSTCQCRRGICQMCYGASPARGRLVSKGEAVGIVAAQSIGEPGTQLTMRTFHTGGVVGPDITSGLPRVEEIFEARIPKGEAIVAEIDGVVEIERAEEGRKIRVVSSELYRDEYPLPPGCHPVVAEGQQVEVNSPLAQPDPPAEGTAPAPVLARIGGRVVIEGDRLFVVYEERDEREYLIPAMARILVEPRARVKAGDSLTEGPKNPQKMLLLEGREAVQRYMVDEVQTVYRSQGVSIHDKHIEIILRQMLRRVRIDSPGDTNLLPGELVDRFTYDDINAKVLAEGGEPATAQAVLLGVTRASLNTDSFLAAASFQETTRVLTEAAITGSIDHLMGLKENVIIGRLIPARSLSHEELEALIGPRPGLAEPAKEISLEALDSLKDVEALAPVEAPRVLEMSEEFPDSP